MTTPLLVIQSSCNTPLSTDNVRLFSPSSAAAEEKEVSVLSQIAVSVVISTSRLPAGGRKARSMARVSTDPSANNTRSLLAPMPPITLTVSSISSTPSGLGILRVSVIWFPVRDLL